MNTKQLEAILKWSDEAQEAFIAMRRLRAEFERDHKAIDQRLNLALTQLSVAVSMAALHEEEQTKGKQ